MGNWVNPVADKELNIQPSSPDWITSHVKSSGLSLIEVERLWFRFEQLGCDADGIIDSKILQHPVTEYDLGVKQILTTMLQPDGQISFIKFLRIMQWVQSASPEEKLRELFGAVSREGSMTSSDLCELLHSSVYPEESKESVKETVNNVFRTTDTEKRGYITDQQFIDAALKQHQPQHQQQQQQQQQQQKKQQQQWKEQLAREQQEPSRTDELLAFRIIPVGIAAEMVLVLNASDTESDQQHSQDIDKELVSMSSSKYMYMRDMAETEDLSGHSRPDPRLSEHLDLHAESTYVDCDDDLSNFW